MNKKKAHNNLKIWQEPAIKKPIEKLSMYETTGQKRMSVILKPHNIVENIVMQSQKKFFNISIGSPNKPEIKLIIATELGYIKEDHEIFNNLEKLKFVSVRP